MTIQLRLAIGLMMAGVVLIFIADYSLPGVMLIFIGALLTIFTLAEQRGSR